MASSVVSTGARSAEWRDLLSMISRLSFREGLSTRPGVYPERSRGGPRSRRRGVAIRDGPAVARQKDWRHVQSRRWFDGNGMSLTADGRARRAGREGLPAVLATRRCRKDQPKTSAGNTGNTGNPRPQPGASDSSTISSALVYPAPRPWRGTAGDRRSAGPSCWSARAPAPCCCASPCSASDSRHSLGARHSSGASCSSGPRASRPLIMSGRDARGPNEHEKTRHRPSCSRSTAPRRTAATSRRRSAPAGPTGWDRSRSGWC
jgi:hypothetical protein